MLMLGYGAMLLVMTFNYPVVFAISGGLALGHTIFEVLGLPQLPFQYQTIAGSGAYLPDSDNCCNKVNAECCDGVPTAQCHPRSDGYTNPNLNPSLIH